MTSRSGTSPTGKSTSPRTAGFCPNGSDRQSGAGAAEDDQGHGSHVSGIITSKGTQSSVGVAPDANIVSIKVLDSGNAFFFFSEILKMLILLSWDLIEILTTIS